ncbi:MAG: hypothetical protein WBB34_04345 [Xanthobacteraceae bacterium]
MADEIEENRQADVMGRAGGVQRGIIPVQVWMNATSMSKIS